VIAMATAFVALQLTLVAVVASLAYSIAGDGDAGVVRAIFVLSVAIDSIAALPGVGLHPCRVRRAHAGSCSPPVVVGEVSQSLPRSRCGAPPGRVTDSGRPPEGLSSP